MEKNTQKIEKFVIKVPFSRSEAICKCAIRVPIIDNLCITNRYTYSDTGTDKHGIPETDVIIGLPGYSTLIGSLCYSPMSCYSYMLWHQSQEPCVYLYNLICLYCYIECIGLFCINYQWLANSGRRLFRLLSGVSVSRRSPCFDMGLKLGRSPSEPVCGRAPEAGWSPARGYAQATSRD